jgi:signal peptidase II
VKGRLIGGAAIAAIVVVLDQITKRWASATLATRAPVPVIGELVRLTYTRNPGVAFGLGAGTHFPFWIFSIAAVIAILVMVARQPAQRRARHIALALILGGAIGNLIDRVISGEVVDFIEIGWGRWHWPVFNVADSAVSIGVVLFALTWSRRAGHAAVPDDASAEWSDARTEGEGDGHGGATGSIPRHGADGPLA